MKKIYIITIILAVLLVVAVSYISYEKFEKNKQKRLQNLKEEIRDKTKLDLAQNFTVSIIPFLINQTTGEIITFIDEENKTIIIDLKMCSEEYTNYLNLICEGG